MHRFIPVLAVVGVASVVVVAAGCGTAAIKTTTVAPLSTAESAGDIGKAPVLTGSHGHIKMKVKVLAYLDPVTGGAPESGYRLVGVKVRLTNVGNTPYSGFPAKEGALSGIQSEEDYPVRTVGGNCVSPSHQNIAPGDTRVVCLPFGVKKAQRGARFDYYLPRSMSYGEWILPESGATRSSSDAASAHKPAKPAQLTVKGKFTLSNNTYERTNPSSHPNYHSDGAGGCEGAGPYREFNSRTPVVVYGYPDRTSGMRSPEYEVARTHFSKGRESSPGSNKWRGGNCFFTYRFTVTRGPKYFEFVIGGRKRGTGLSMTFDSFRAPGATDMVAGEYN